jgi:ubiquinone/menaquinone biosynthesis C-methylase UbiE
MKSIHSVHHLSQREIYKKSLELRKQGVLYNLLNMEIEDIFRGSIDRFSEIAYRLKDSRKILDVGSGHGLFLSLLCELGHECYSVDFLDITEKYPEIYKKKPVEFCVCNVEIDTIPHEDNFFDAVACSQVLEHFTHSHLPAMKEIYRVLKPNGIVEIDVPNAVCFRNRSRMIRGKHITYDYEEHYLYAEPFTYKNLSFYPKRHNREFTLKELRILLNATKFKNIEASFLKSRRYREGLEKIRSIGSAFRDFIPSLRKSIIAFAKK